MSILSFIPILLIFSLIILLAVFIGVFVYKDAPKHGLDPLPWTLISIFVPNFIGFIIYLIVRSGKKEMTKCPNCGKEVGKDFIKCPYCDTTLSNKCATCGKKVDLDWETCPYCATKIQRDVNQMGYQNYSGGTVNEKRSKNVIIIIIIGIVVAIVISLISFLFFNGSVKYNSGVSIMSIENNIPKKIGGKYGDNSIVSKTSSYGFWQGTKLEEIKIDKNGKIEISYSSLVEEGSLEIILLNSKKDMIEKFPSNETGVFTLNVKNGDTFYIEIIGNKTKGNYDIQIGQF